MKTEKIRGWDPSTAQQIYIKNSNKNLAQLTKF